MTTRVRSSDGIRLAVYESGVRDGSVVVAVHGYPDNHTVWDGVAAALGDTHRVVSYDVRGAGASDAPPTKAGYRIPLLVDDLLAVLDEVAPDRPVHLLAHDWGSIQSWAALTDPRTHGRLASFTSVSGPSLAHAAAWLRGFRKYPRAALRQLAHSYYMLLFQVPRLPEAAVRAGMIDRAVGKRDHRDQTNGINLYRANRRGGLAGATPAQIDIPVLVIAPQDDPFVTPALQTQAPVPFVRNLRTMVIPGGHWILTRRPEVIAGCMREFVDEVDVED
ncbi:MAG: alpha/beta fold hydrolase [Jatrophihabitantaceae bacterium]